MSALLLPNEILSMTAAAARRLVEAGDGDCALLYLALLDTGGEMDRAGEQLGWPEERLARAHGGLTRLGLAQERRETPPAKPLRLESRLPEYSRRDIMDAMEREPEFTGLYRETERLLSRPLSDNDLKCLYTIYDHLALPSEVILLLTGHVVQTARRRKGGQSRPGVRMSQVQKEAFRWKRLGLDTVELGEAYLRRQQGVDLREWDILSLIGVSERRAAVEKEREYIEQWVEMAMDDALISMAYERTVYQKGTMNWPYMNKILQSWHRAGYRTPEQVRTGDRPAVQRQGKKRVDSQPGCQPSRDRIQKNADWLDRFLEEQEKGG